MHLSWRKKTEVRHRFSLYDLQFPRGELDKVGRKAKSIFGPTFCVELLFGPSEPHHPDVVININNIDDSF